MSHLEVIVMVMESGGNLNDPLILEVRQAGDIYGGPLPSPPSP